MLIKRGLVLAMLVGAGFSANAELTQVQIGGRIEVFGVWYSDLFEPSGAAVRIPAFLLPGRAIGINGAISAFRFGDHGNNADYVEQRTRLHVLATFTDDVEMFVEFDSLDIWGDDFRSNYLTGADVYNPGGLNEPALYQSYIRAKDLFGYPLTLTLGRQELKFGSGWLVGAEPGPDPNIGQSFDAIRLTYAAEDIGLTVDAWASKLAETGAIEEDGDIDFYGFYASYAPLASSGIFSSRPESLLFMPMRLATTPFRLAPFTQKSVGTDEVLQFDAYYFLVRDGVSINDTNGFALGEWLEDAFNVDDYNSTNLNTIGTRGAGSLDWFDWEIEVAYQWGEADALGSQFVPNGGIFGDDGAEWENWGGHAVVTYLFEEKEGPHLAMARTTSET